MKSGWPWIAVALLAGGCATAPNQGNAGWLAEEARSEPSRHVVVTVRNDSNAVALGVGSTPRGYGTASSYAASREARERAHAIAERYRLREVASWPILPLDVYCLVYRIGDDSDRDALLAAMNADPRVESAQAMGAFDTQAAPEAESRYNDTYARLQRNLAELAVPQAQHWSRGQGVRMAIIDTGIAVAHADLAGRIVASRNFVDGDAGQFSRDRHGTAVAGVIAAVANNNVGIVGIAPEVRLLAYKACWERPGRAEAVCNTFTLAQALAAAIEAKVDIVNLSLAGPRDPLLTRLVRSAQDAGIIFVGAAPSTGLGFPIDVGGVIGVEALESSRGERGLIGAPGVDIFTLTPDDRYDAISGSSMAAAEVSAVIALLHARDARLTAARARRLLEASARPVQTAAGNRAVISACAAISAQAPGTPCGSAGETTRQAQAAARAR